MVDYIEPKTFNDFNFNQKLLIEKVNHKQTLMNTEIKKNSKEVREMKKDVSEIKVFVEDIVSMWKGMSWMLKFIAAVITLTGILIGIGVALGIK